MLFRVEGNLPDNSPSISSCILLDGIALVSMVTGSIFLYRCGCYYLFSFPPDEVMTCGLSNKQCCVTDL